MQLKKKDNIRRALAMATCSLLGTAGASTAAAVDKDWEIESAVLYYSESDGRVTAVEPVISARKEIRDDEFISAKLVVDTLTGASPNGAAPSNTAQTFTRPSGRGSYITAAGDLPLDDTFNDTRGALSVNWDKPLSRLMRQSLGLSLSVEHDYVASGVLRKVWRFDGSDNIPRASEIDSIKETIGWHMVRWKDATITLQAGMEIDLGGIGKEYAVDRCFDMLSQQTDQPFLLNFGGDLRTSGAQKKWQAMASRRRKSLVSGNSECNTAR